MSHDVKGWIGTLWPLVAAVVAVAISWATFGSRLSSAETAVDKHEKAINGADGQGGLRQTIDEVRSDVRIVRAILDERLPAMR